VELESTENLDAFLAKKALSEIRDQFAAGYKTAESNIADLKYPAHERFFTVPETECPLATKADREL
jgi:hypothetical protein